MPRSPDAQKPRCPDVHKSRTDLYNTPPNLNQGSSRSVHWDVPVWTPWCPEGQFYNALLGRCQENQCRCEHGTFATGVNCPNNGRRICLKCDFGYHLGPEGGETFSESDGKDIRSGNGIGSSSGALNIYNDQLAEGTSSICIANECKCTNGTASQLCGENYEIESCEICKEGYKIVEEEIAIEVVATEKDSGTSESTSESTSVSTSVTGKSCQPKTCQCPNGLGKTNGNCPDESKPFNCQSCHLPYQLSNNFECFLCSIYENIPLKNPRFTINGQENYQAGPYPCSAGGICQNAYDLLASYAIDGIIKLEDGSNLAGSNTHGAITFDLPTDQTMVDLIRIFTVESYLTAGMVVKVDDTACGQLSAGNGEDLPFVYKCNKIGSRIEVSHSDGKQVLIGEILACGQFA